MIYWQSIQFNILKAFNFSPNGFIFSLQFIIVYMKNRKLSLSPSLYFKVLTYPLILDHINTNGIAMLSKYPIKCLELTIIFSNNFEITVLSNQHHTFLLVFCTIKFLLKVNITNFSWFFCTIKFFFSYFCLTSRNIITLSKSFVVSIF